MFFVVHSKFFMLTSPVHKKSDSYISKRIRLESPIIHIGSSLSSLNRFEFVQTPNKVYLPNTEALAKAFKKQLFRGLHSKNRRTW